MPISHSASGMVSNLSLPLNLPCATFAQSSATRCRIQQLKYTWPASAYSISRIISPTRQLTHPYSATYAPEYVGTPETGRVADNQSPYLCCVQLSPGCGTMHPCIIMIKGCTGQRSHWPFMASYERANIHLQLIIATTNTFTSCVKMLS